MIELPKLPEELGEGCSSLELWAKFIDSERKEDLDMIAQMDPYIERLQKAAINQPGQGEAAGI